LYDQSTNYEIGQEKQNQNPQATMRLKDIILLKWDEDISIISKKLQKGKLIQFKSSGREMNVYMINAFLSDIDSNAKVSFQRNENNFGQFVTHRWIQLEVSSGDEIEDKYEQIISVLPSFGMKIMNLGNYGPIDSTFNIEDIDGSGGYQLNFRKDSKTMTIRLDITRYKTLSEQNGT